MFRTLILAVSLAALPAAAFDIIKWAEELGDKQMEKWRKEKLQTATKGRDPEERLKAVEGLPYTDPDACAAFAIALSDSDARVRKAAASQLWSAEKRAEPFRPQLEKALEDPDANVVCYAAGALQASGVKESELVAPRKRVLESPDAAVNCRFLVARNLVGYEAPLKLVRPMIAYVEHTTERSNVEMAERALERLVKNTKDRALIPPLWEALVEAKNGHIPLMKALGTFDPKPEGWARTLVRQLDHPNPKVRDAALGQMRSIKDEKEIAVWMPAAARMLDDPDKGVRSEALWALGSAKGLAADHVEKVVHMMGDQEPSVRRNAARALEDIAQGNQPLPAATRARIASVARPALERAAAQEEDKELRDAARSALRDIERTSRGVQVAAAAPSEAAGMAALRARKVTFDETSWYRALSEVDVELVRAFLDAGMSPSAPVSDMGAPMRLMFFHSKACSPNVRPTSADTKAIVKLLLERGADIHGADKNGNTAITEAASKGCDRELMRMLIKAGAKVNATNGSGLTPFEMGLWWGHDGLEELIAAGYRMPPDKAKIYLEGYKDRPASIAMVKKATAKK